MGDRRIDQAIYTYFCLYVVMRAGTGVKVSIQMLRRPVTHGRVIEADRADRPVEGQFWPIMQSTQLWKVAGRNACRALIGSDRKEFRPLHNQSDLRKLMSASGAR